MKQSLGQPVVIENVGGAGGSIAVGRLARAEPDGYTIDIGQWDTHVGSIIYPLNYDLQKDFAPIGLVSLNPQLMVGKKTLPADNLKDLVAWMKANPDKITFVNQNAAAQVSGILFEKATGQKVQFIPYRGAGPAMTDLVAGQVDLLVGAGRGRAAAGAGRDHQGARESVAEPFGRRARRSDFGRSRACPAFICRDGSASSRRKATPKDVIAKLNAAMVRGACRSGRAQALHRPWPRRRVARAADPGRACRLPQGRDREMVADHQGRGDRRRTVRRGALRPCQPDG